MRLARSMVGPTAICCSVHPDGYVGALVAGAHADRVAGYLAKVLA